MSDNSIKGNKFDYMVLKRLMAFVRPYRWQFCLLLVTTVSAALIAPLIPILINILIKSVTRHVNPDLGVLKQDYALVRLELLNVESVNALHLMLAVLLIQGVFYFFNTFMSGWLGQTIIRDIRNELYQHVLKLQLKFFDNTPIGRLVTRCISDIETLAEVFSQGLAALLAEVLQLVLIMAVMFYMNWKLSLITLSVFPFLLFATYVFKEKIKNSFGDVRNAVAKLNTFVQERVSGMNIVQIFGAEKREYKKFVEINEDHKKANLRSVKYYSIYFPVAEVLGAIGVGLIVWYGGHQVVSGYIDGPGELIAFIMFLNMFFRPIRQIADRFNTLQMGLISTERIIRLLDDDSHIPNNGEVVLNDIKGDIKFEDVIFAYNEGEPVLRGVTFEVEAGHSLAIVGATGAGKSSVINLLNRYYEFGSGSITIDENDIRSIELSSLRKKVGVVLQDVFLFSNSIRENIKLGAEDITDDQIWKAAEHVGAAEFIRRLPNGLDYNVQERGATLSAGQRQLISFVRAMVYEPAILVLDEATSSIDSETEHLIQEATEKLMKGRTSIVIAHRLSTIQNAHKILVLDKGSVAEEGSHQELMDKKGMYHHLQEMQLAHAV